ncbi:Ig-like domain-containing protein, partial [Psychrobacter sp. W2-37-MNA-CIBAN-0211]|uniref:Ig-like domain-containing protein n=1 Tax=Psychrobacter sp. W2-37-MNA-CIBAN-0211 TaxID=3140443 RepID=UPI003332FBA7
SGGTLPAPVVNATDGTLDSASTTGTVPTIIVPPLVARNDSDDLDLGSLQVTYYDPISDSDLDILGVAEGTGGADSNLNFTVSEGASGTVSIEVKQTALVAVADAVNIEIYNSNGERVYVGTTGDNPLVGDVIGLELLGLTGNDTLTATVSGLEPGDYTIVVRNDRSVLEALVADITLTELGEAGVVLGPDNQASVLSAVETALNSDYPILQLGTTVRGILEVALQATDELGAGELVGLLQGNVLLNTLLGGVIDPVLDAVAEALLSNTLTLLQTTDITATVTEFDYANDTVITGNVIDPDSLVTDEPGEDTITFNTTVTDIDSNSNPLVPTIEVVDGITVFTIQGQYGVLVIDENGDYTYTANGDFASSGQSETFTYTISDGVTSDTAELVINIDTVIDTTPPDAPTIDDPIAGDNIVNGTEAAASFAVTGTGVSGDTITLTDGSNNVLGTAIVDAAGNWSVNVDRAEVNAMAEGAEQLSATATDYAGNVSVAATATITVDTTVPVAIDNEVALDIGFQTSTTNAALQSTSVGGLLNVGVLAGTIDVSLLSGGNALSFNIAENTTRQVTVDGSGSALLSLSVVLGLGDIDFDLLVYRVEEGSSQAILVYEQANWLDGTGILPTTWNANDLPLPEFEGGGTYYVTLGNNGGLLNASLLSDLTIRTTSDVITSYNPPATVSASVNGNVITDSGTDGTDVITAGTVVSAVNNSPVETGGSIINGTYGTLTINPDGSYNYVASPNFTGTFGDIDSFEYTVTAPNGESSTASLDITLDYNADIGAFSARSMLLDESFTIATDDTIELPDTSLTTSSDGLDTLSFEGADQVISLSDMMQLDIIDISGIGANTLNVAAKDVNSAIYVRGDSDDTVNLEGDSWSNVEQVTSDGEMFNVWQAGSDISTQIYIDTDITNII